MNNSASRDLSKVPLLSVEEVNRIRCIEDIAWIVASRPDREYIEPKQVLKDAGDDGEQLQEAMIATK